MLFTTSKVAFLGFAGVKQLLLISSSYY